MLLNNHRDLGWFAFYLNPHGAVFKWELLSFGSVLPRQNCILLYHGIPPTRDPRGAQGLVSRFSAEPQPESTLHFPNILYILKHSSRG